ncbi:hypothetical protein [Sphingopyxis macrogoltabida]|uniref:hypothetical protein n=1 Tax=Sphingopyxis macrogoltabida TaxID=33050 RepID=UPI0006ECEF79|nr:hypothetical protein [Sphingopyxis macrogoltabida]ALJ14109.1 hypothetical protein LH19_14645 [Sphingopyxis macrogoltabida]
MASVIHRVDMKQVKISVKLPRAFGLRIWLTAKLIRLAGLVAPVTIEVEVSDA